MANNEAIQASETTASVSESVLETMKAAVPRNHEASLQVETLCTPRPKTSETLIKVAACGLYYSDLRVIGDTITSSLPAVFDHEVSDTIAELGPGNEHTGLTAGQKVAGSFLIPCGQCDACTSRRDEPCGPFFDLNHPEDVLYGSATRLATLDGELMTVYSMGGLAEYAAVSSIAVASIPDTTSMMPVATLGCAAMIGCRTARRGADPCYREAVAVIATRGVDANIAQVTRTFSASQVAAVDVDDEKLAPIFDCGTMAMVNSVTQGVRREVLRLTGGKGVDVSSEALGIPATWTATLDVLAGGGRMVPIGLRAGVQTTEMKINHTMCRLQLVFGSHRARARQGLPAIVDLADRSVIDYRNVVSHRLPLEEAGTGYTTLCSREIQGRAVVGMSL